MSRTTPVSLARPACAQPALHVSRADLTLPFNARPSTPTGAVQSNPVYLPPETPVGLVVCVVAVDKQPGLDMTFLDHGFRSTDAIGRDMTKSAGNVLMQQWLRVGSIDESNSK